MRTLSASLLALLLWAAPVFAQNPFMDSGSITAVSSGGACSAAPAGCAVFLLPNGVLPSVTLQVSGTYSATLLFEATSDGTNWKTITGINLADGSSATGTTTTGQFSFQNSGLTGLRVRCTAFTSGTAVIAAVRGYASAKWLTPFFSALTTGPSGIATTSTDGVVVANTTDSTVSVTAQWGPRIRQCGTAWKSNATAASETDCLIAEIRPLTGAAATTFTYAWAGSIASGAYSDLMTLTSAGTLTVNTITPTTLNLPGSSAALTVGGTRLIYTTAPTISSGFGTSPTIVNANSTASFVINVGTGAVATSGVVSMPASTTGWSCWVNDLTAAAAHVAYNTRQTASTTTSVTLENQTTSTGAAVAWGVSDILRVSCVGY